MPSVQRCDLPAGTLLGTHAGAGAYTDCYTLTVSGRITLSRFVESFYTSRVFKLERWLIGVLLRLPASDVDARELASGQRSVFSAWQVESRAEAQIILAAGRTRSWLMVSPPDSVQDSAVTRLYFGSAVVPRRRGGMGRSFTALLGFHKLYSRVLLAAAARRIERGQG